MGRALGTTVVIVVGCGFQSSAPNEIGNPVDAALTTDAPHGDAPQVAAATCRSSSSTMRGLVGGTGGGLRAPVTCPDDEMVVAVLVEMTDGPKWQGRLASARAALTCGRIARPEGGVYQTTSAGTLLANSDGVCDVFSPAVATPIAACPAGEVMVGLRAAVVPHTPTPTCFSNVAALCAPIGDDGRPTAPASEVPIAATDNAGLTPVAVVCEPGEAVRGIRSRDGCGLDGMDLLCGPVSCD